MVKQKFTPEPYQRPDCRSLNAAPGGIICVSDGTLDGFTPVTDDTFFD